MRVQLLRIIAPLGVLALAPFGLPAQQQPPPEARKVPAIRSIPSPEESFFKKRELSNGLDVIVIEDRTNPIATIDLTVNTGAFTESDEFAGLSHLYEHMFFKANGAIPSQEAFMRRVRELGIIYNGYTSNEVVTYYFTLPSRHLSPGLEFMSNAIKTPAFIEDELTRERQVVLGEFDRNEASPEFALRYALDSAMWSPYVSRKQALGQRDVISTATVEKMQMIRDRFYLPNNSALIVSGDVDAELVFDLAQRNFGDWKPGPEPFPTWNPPDFPPLKTQLVVREAKVPDVVIRAQFAGPSIGKDEPDVHIAQLWATLLNQPTSRFFNNLADSGLATQLSAYAQNARFTGTLNFFIRTTPDLAPRAIQALKREIIAMGQPGYFSDEDVRIGQEIIEDRSMFERDDLYDFTIHTVARWWAQGGLDYYETFPEVVRTITPAQITEFSREYLADQPWVLGVGARNETLDQLKLTGEVMKW